MTPFAILALLALAPAELRPNIVLIYCDDLGYADIGPFGAKTARTPNLDKLAKRGRSFTNFHVAQPVCSASRAALLTGCYPNRLGFTGPLDPRPVTGSMPRKRPSPSCLKEAVTKPRQSANGTWAIANRFCPPVTALTAISGYPIPTICGRIIPKLKRDLSQPAAFSQ